VNTIAGLIGSVLDLNNWLTACEGVVTPTPAPSVCQGPAVPVTTGSPSPGDTDDTGCVDPTDAAGTKAAAAAGKCVAKLVGTWIKCHAAFAKGVLKNQLDPNIPTDEICEGDGSSSNPKSAVAAFKLCLQKLGPSLPGCVTTNVPAILAATQTNLDSANGLLYCASPSGAFVQ
jgi:hypothetical protein